MSATEAPLIGGRYRVLGVLGSGATGTVYIAQDEELDRRVAIKRLSDHLAGDPVFLARFRDEARIMAQVDHPNVVRVYNLHEGADGALLVVEYVDGSSLRQVVGKAGRLSPEQTLGVLQGALTGLARAHELGVVHRDIKPENILADRAGVSKLADFGQAMDGVTPDSDAARGVPTGTPAYISPEAGRGARMDSRSDIYSAGAMTFEILTGRPPFVADNPMALVRMHVTEEPPDPRSVDRSVPPGVAAMVRRSMSKDPDARFQDVPEFLAALEAAAEEGYGPDWKSRSAIASLVMAVAGAAASAIAVALPTAAATEVAHGAASVATGQASIAGAPPAAATPPTAAPPGAQAPPPPPAPAGPAAGSVTGHAGSALTGAPAAAAGHLVRNAVAAVTAVAVVAGGGLVANKVLSTPTQQSSAVRLDGVGSATGDGPAPGPQFCASVELDFTYTANTDAGALAALAGKSLTITIASSPPGAPQDGTSHSSPVGPDGKATFAMPKTGVPKGGATWSVSRVTLDGQPLQTQTPPTAQAKC